VIDSCSKIEGPDTMSGLLFFSAGSLRRVSRTDSAIYA